MHLPPRRIIGANSSPRFNEVMLELVCERERLKQTPLMFTFHICLCPGACLFWIIKQRALSSLRIFLFFLSLFFPSPHFLSLSLVHTLYPPCSSFFLLLHVSSTSFGCSSGSHWDANGSLWRGTLGTSINPGVYSPEKKKGGSATIVRRLFHLYCATGPCFLSSVLMPPDSVDSSKIQDTSG